MRLNLIVVDLNTLILSDSTIRATSSTQCSTLCSGKFEKLTVLLALTPEAWWRALHILVRMLHLLLLGLCEYLVVVELLDDFTTLANVSSIGGVHSWISPNG